VTALPRGPEPADNEAVRPSQLLFVALVMPVALGVAAARPPVPEVPRAESVDTTLFLVGDAGDPDRDGEPVLKALRRELARDPARSLAVFLGDNVYPRGLPAPEDPLRSEMERRLRAQVDAVREVKARAVFVPGNHDWDEEGPAGWEAVRRQGRYIDERGASAVFVLPKHGCPGPSIVDAGEELRLVVLDTQWWLHQGPKPLDPASPCAADSEPEVLAALQDALQTAGTRQVVVAAHHPLRSGGPHGGYFSFRQHVFPLTDARSSLYIPLPGIGSLYPLARRAGTSAQDMHSRANARMRESLEKVLRARPPLVYAAGHEHSQQVFEGGAARYVLVSGTGIYGHSTPVRRLPSTRYASRRAGFMRLDVERGGRVRLGVLEVDGRGEAAEGWAAWLK
jgi:hypothetical protein